MPIETVEGSSPPRFHRGQGPLARLAILSALALFLMVADARFHAMQPVRAAVATVLYPAQWLALQPVQWTRAALGYFTDIKTLQQERDQALRALVKQSQRAGQVEQLLLENGRLRALLKLKERLTVPSQAAQVLYDATDPYGRRVVINKGQLQGIRLGSPVMDESGVLGQVTRVYPLMSEVTLLTDPEQVTPVVNTRTGSRMVLYGDSSRGSGGLELRYVMPGDDLRVGDLLATSGLDGVYPPGLPVAVVDQAPSGSGSGTSTIACTPVAQMQGSRFVMVLTPQEDAAPAADSGDAGAADTKTTDAKATDTKVTDTKGTDTKATNTKPATSTKPATPAVRGTRPAPAASQAPRKP